MKITVKSTKFVDELEKRVRSLKGKDVRARIQVPLSLKFWYWLEFGTLARGTSPLGSPGEGASGSPKLIVPVNAGILSFPDSTTGEQQYRDWVFSEGIRPRRMVQQSLQDIHDKWVEDLLTSLGKDGIRLSVIKKALLKETMPFALKQIVDHMAREAPGNRFDNVDSWAKLGGRHASEVFEEGAVISDFTDKDVPPPAGNEKDIPQPHRP